MYAWIDRDSFSPSPLLSFSFSFGEMSSDQKVQQDSDSWNREQIASKEELHSEYEQDVHEGNKTGLHESDAALADAPWQYKAIALVTALMLPGMYYSITRAMCFETDDLFST